MFQNDYLHVPRSGLAYVGVLQPVAEGLEHLILYLTEIIFTLVISVLRRYHTKRVYALKTSYKESICTEVLESVVT